MKPYGTLSLEQTVSRTMVTRTKVSEPHWIVTGNVPVNLLNRLIPEAWSRRSDQVAVSDTMANVDIISWLMLRYPLTVDPQAEARWNERLQELHVNQKRREDLETLLPVLPSGQFKGELREFQKLGLDFLLKTGGRALLADEVGLGKGVQSLAFLATEEQEVFPVCIVAPLVVLKHWEREIEKFLTIQGARPSVETIRTGKTSAEGQAYLIGAPAIFLINYDLLAKRAKDIAPRVRTIIFDEVQALRNTTTQRYGAALELVGSPTVKHVLGLSGTPIHNNGGEIWAISNIIRPGLLGHFQEFAAQHCYTDFRGRVHARNPQALYELLREELMLRRRKIEVLQELPPKQRVKEFIEADLELYNREVAKILAVLDQKLAGAKTQFERTAFRQHVIKQERQIAAIAKVEYIVKWVQAILESEEPIVVYCHHLLIRDALQRYLGHHKPCFIFGGQGDTERDQEIQRFQNGESRLMLAGLRAGSLGISLTRATIVVFAELDWSPVIHQQAEGRLHRIGQEHQVLAYYLIATGTLDEKVAEVLVDKTEEISGILGDVPEGENTPEAVRALDELRKMPAFASVPVPHVLTVHAEKIHAED
jgi:SNF2 family DNA or RNA helicase